MSLIKKDKMKIYNIEFTYCELEVILKLLKAKKYIENQYIEKKIKEAIGRKP